MPMERVAGSGITKGATEHEQNASAAPPGSTIGTLNAPLTATADSGTRPGKTLIETSVSSTLHLSRVAFGSGILPQSIRNSPKTPVESELEAVQHRLSRDNTTPETHYPTTANHPAVHEQGSRSTRNVTVATNGHLNDTGIPRKMDDGNSYSTPGSKGKGKGPGRPRGGGKNHAGTGGGGSGRKTKRKRADDDDDGDASDSSEVYTPVATTTKSGRSIQKPTAYVPPPAPSPVSSSKRKRLYRKNPESAVCKACLRGTSPAGNMIVFCDGCNTPYHRYCHHPPIDQAVVDEVDMEWYCRQCEKRRLKPVPESEVADFVSAEGTSLEQRRKYFSILQPGMMVTLLVRATTLQPSLPLFDPQFGAKHNTVGTQEATPTDKTKRASKPPFQASRSAPRARSSLYITWSDEDEDEDEDGEEDDEGYDPSFHPANYPKPGQGLMKTLPPDKDDEAWLVDDDDDSGAIQHIYQADPTAANVEAEAEDAHKKPHDLSVDKPTNA